MKRVKILLTNDGNFHFDDIDKELFSRLIKEGIRFNEDESLGRISLNNKRLRKRLKSPLWWKKYLDDFINWLNESYKRCSLCHLDCRANRFSKKGLCGVPPDGEYFDVFIHPGMDGGLSDVLHIMSTGCSLNCFFCHKDQEKDNFARRFMSSIKTDDVIDRLNGERFKYVAFSGGNPDENVLAILNLLRKFEVFKLPIIWETHGCVDERLLLKLCNIVDLFIVTLKFGNDRCASKWCGVENYTHLIKNSLSCLTDKRADILVRISRIPGHEDCCLPFLREIPKEFGIAYHKEIRIHPELNLQTVR